MSELEKWVMVLLGIAVLFSAFVVSAIVQDSHWWHQRRLKRCKLGKHNWRDEPVRDAHHVALPLTVRRCRHCGNGFTLIRGVSQRERR